MTLRWATVRGDPPADLLSPAERAVLESFRFPLRRRKWLIGRWAAKRLLGAALAARDGHPPSPDRLTIGNDPSGAPWVELAGEGRLPWSISLSRRADLGFAVLSEGPHVGADLELTEPRYPGLVRDFFTAEERAWVARRRGRARHRAVALIWSAKEAVLKALGIGLRLDTRRIAVDLSPPGGCPGWRAASVTVRATTERQAGSIVYWRDQGDHVLTIASASPAERVKTW